MFVVRSYVGALPAHAHTESGCRGGCPRPAVNRLGVRPWLGRADWACALGSGEPPEGGRERGGAGAAAEEGRTRGARWAGFVGACTCCWLRGATPALKREGSAY